jgi:uncharacterized protein YndB with AHSA1/START domain
MMHANSPANVETFVPGMQFRPLERITIADEVTVAAPPARVFAVLTTPTEMVRCFPFESVETTGGLGTAILLRGSARGQSFTDVGVITAWEPAREFAYAYWSDQNAAPESAEHQLSIRYVLTPRVDSTTQLRVEHINIPAGPYAESMAATWVELLRRVANHAEASPL